MMTFGRRVTSGLSCGALVAMCAGACTNAQLAPIPPPPTSPGDNKVQVNGEFCTTDPDDLSFPVKILFMIDTSSSMEVTDPSGNRVLALQQVVGTLDGTPGVEFGIIGFGLGPSILTERCDDYVNRVNCSPGFATDTAHVLNAAVGAGQAAGTTDYIGALQQAVSMIAADMALSDEEDLQNARYVLIFLSDGIPDADSTFGPEQFCDVEVDDWATNGIADPDGLTGALDEIIEEYQELAKRYDVRELTFNGAFLAEPNASVNVKACGSNLIAAMARKGEGVFRDFSSGEALNFLFVDFTSYKRIFSLKNFTVTNLNARPFSEALYVEDNAVRSDDPTLALGVIDSDGDGLTDEREVLLGTSPMLQDSDADGFSDLVEVQLQASGFDALDPTDADCAAEVDRQDLDGDGLRDCEERFAGTNPKTFDTDLDGFGDGIEYLYGSNPSIPDNLLDVDFDGADNGAEIRWHSQPDTDDISYLSEHAYRYAVVETGIEGAQTCYGFNVSNVSLASTIGALDPSTDDTGALSQARGLGGGVMDVGENRIIIEVAEAPFDAPREPGVPRLACVTARYNREERIRIPANGILNLTRDDFIPAPEFDPLIHCQDPKAEEQ